MTHLAGNILMDGLMAAIAAMGFAAVSQPTHRSLPYIALLAAMGHALRFVLTTCASLDIVLSSLAAGVLIGFVSLPFARRIHTPMTCLLIPALLPMVPGMYAYRAVFALIKFIQSGGTALQPDYLHMFMSNFFTSIMVVTVLAAGAILPKFLFRDLAYTATRHRP